MFVLKITIIIVVPSSIAIMIIIIYFIIMVDSIGITVIVTIIITSIIIITIIIITNVVVIISINVLVVLAIEAHPLASLRARRHRTKLHRERPFEAGVAQTDPRGSERARGARVALQHKGETVGATWRAVYVDDARGARWSDAEGEGGLKALGNAHRTMEPRATRQADSASARLRCGVGSLSSRLSDAESA